MSEQELWEIFREQAVLVWYTVPINVIGESTFWEMYESLFSICEDPNLPSMCTTDTIEYKRQLIRELVVWKHTTPQWHLIPLNGLKFVCSTNERLIPISVMFL